MSQQAEARPLSELFLAGIGWAAQGLDAADELSDEVARRLGVDRDEVRKAVRETLANWRGEAGKLGERPVDVVDKALGKTGFARREDLEELALRVAQLEHRLKLLESA
jgi:polyhydroxyalkanoate synthesis regulator phasin